MSLIPVRGGVDNRCLMLLYRLLRFCFLSRSIISVILLYAALFQSIGSCPFKKISRVLKSRDIAVISSQIHDHYVTVNGVLRLKNNVNISVLDLFV